ncbi:MAG: S1 RNA-binding domain-containing protein [Candidatus Aenigmatarchaeota archaeon]|nr:MAG: S1 RNA-binding domain-containing protein [Candidatus Aenigmarchaeota archaeon]
MVFRRNRFPQTSEIVIGTVKAVNPYSVFVRLDEYPAEGMVHVSEVARKWVRDIRTFAKEGGKVVCVVMGVDEQKGHLALSMKRVSDGEKNRRLQEWKRDQKGEKLLEKVGEKKGLKLNEVYESVGFDIQDAFRDMLEAFETAQKDVTLLERKGFTKEWVSVLREIADENLEIKEKEIRGVLEAKLYTPDAIDTLKRAFGDAAKKHGVSIRYVSAPRYSITFTTADPKKGDKLVNGAAEEIMKAVRSQGGEASFEME